MPATFILHAARTEPFELLLEKTACAVKFSLVHEKQID